ncbi:unnamed protein product [Onchocerca ochengi]|uniref:Secreted protein n=1 Tax=Onchocerca ochengi TaxID=42157 RepID=A0A182EQZ5_ONCOC|nr:unnamed protein product [Onchocerca ochengi]
MNYIIYKKWIFLTVITLTEITYGIVINSFNGLTVGPGQLNGMGSDIPVSINGLGSFVPVPASVFMKSGVLPDPIPDPDTSIDSSQYDIDELGSFQHNIGGTGSFKNNAGISLETTELAATSDIAQNLAAIHAYSMVFLSLILIFSLIFLVN